MPRLLLAGRWLLPVLGPYPMSKHIIHWYFHPSRSPSSLFLSTFQLPQTISLSSYSSSFSSLLSPFSPFLLAPWPPSIELELPFFLPFPSPVPSPPSSSYFFSSISATSSPSVIFTHSIFEQREAVWALWGFALAFAVALALALASGSGDSKVPSPSLAGP